MKSVAVFSSHFPLPPSCRNSLVCSGALVGRTVCLALCRKWAAQFALLSAESGPHSMPCCLQKVGISAEHISVCSRALVGRTVCLALCKESGHLCRARFGVQQGTCRPQKVGRKWESLQSTFRCAAGHLSAAESGQKVGISTCSSVWPSRPQLQVCDRQEPVFPRCIKDREPGLALEEPTQTGSEPRFPAFLLLTRKEPDNEAWSL